VAEKDVCSDLPGMGQGSSFPEKEVEVVSKEVCKNYHPNN
jgi:hypothetical protein